MATSQQEIGLDQPIYRSASLHKRVIICPPFGALDFTKVNEIPVEHIEQYIGHETTISVILPLFLSMHFHHLQAAVVN
jgi:hypothetical protein